MFCRQRLIGKVLIVNDIAAALLVAGGIFWIVKRGRKVKTNPELYKQPKRKKARKTSV